MRANWTLPGDDAVLAERLLRRQIETPVAARWLAHGGIVLAAVLTLLFAELGGQAPSWMGFWPMAVLATVGLRFSLYRVAGPYHHDPARYLKSFVCRTQVIAMVFAVGPCWSYLHGPESLRMTNATIVGGMLCAGALNLARVPLAGLAWLGTLTLCSVLTMLKVGHSVDLLMAFAVVALAAVLLVDMLDLSRQFVSRCQTEFEAERQATLIELLMREFEGESRDWFWECDDTGRLKHVSSRMEEVLQRSASELLDRPLSAVLRDALAEGAGQGLAALALRLSERRPFRGVTLALSVHGVDSWWSLGGKPVLDGAGRVTGWRGLGNDVTADHLHRLELQRLAETDALTGLVNRHGFNLFLQRHLGGGTHGERGEVALLVLDLDKFKAINDAHGHAVGDQLIRAVADRLQAQRARGECLARLGGDEYALVVFGAAQALQPERRAEQMLMALRQPFMLAGLHIEIRGSIGMALDASDGCDAVRLQGHADMALYAAKAEGRDRLRVYDEDIGERVRARAELIHDLNGALAAGQFWLNYQPVFDAVSGQPTHAEALLRWRHPDRGVVSPSTFIPMAEETGLIVEIGAWALRRACRDAMSWPEATKVSVNVSPVQVLSHGWLDSVRQVLAETGLPPGRLNLEMTETTLADASPDLEEALSALRQLGVGLMLDDFGTGYSSLAYLQRFRFDGIKIDRSFVAPLSTTPAGEPLATVKAIIGLARALGMPCTAEGVENAEQVRALAELGCQALQGYGLAPPMAADAFAQGLTQLSWPVPGTAPRCTRTG